MDHSTLGSALGLKRAASNLAEPVRTQWFSKPPRGLSVLWPIGTKRTYIPEIRRSIFRRTREVSGLVTVGTGTLRGHFGDTGAWWAGVLPCSPPLHDRSEFPEHDKRPLCANLLAKNDVVALAEVNWLSQDEITFDKTYSILGVPDERLWSRQDAGQIQVGLTPMIIPFQRSSMRSTANHIRGYVDGSQRRSTSKQSRV